MDYVPVACWRLCGYGVAIQMVLFEIEKNYIENMQWALTYGPLQRSNKSHTASSTSFKPLHQFHIPTSPRNSPSHSENKEYKINLGASNLKNFRDKRRGEGETEELECFKLITLPKPSFFTSLDDLNRLEFPVLSYSMKQLIRFSRQVCESSAERELIGRSFNLGRLVELIAQNYQAVSYHNFSHAFSVLLMLFQAYSRSSTLRRALTQKQWFYVFMAALAHDINHPGTTNALEIKMKSQLASDAHNVSVLEKMHLSTLWKILKKNSQVNFLQGYSSYESAEIKNLITRMVLATDIAKHFNGLDQLKRIGKQGTKLSGENALVVVQQLFHACDIGNPCIDFDGYMNWGALVSHEFNEVALKEEKLGLEVTGYLKFDGMGKFYGGQIGFCKGLVLPLWRELALVFPGLEEMSTNVTRNIEELEARKKALTAA